MVSVCFLLDKEMVKRKKKRGSGQVIPGSGNFAGSGSFPGSGGFKKRRKRRKKRTVAPRSRRLGTRVRKTGQRGRGRLGSVLVAYKRFRGL